MEILCFKIKGKLAHFRKYFANNTALSFTIPPRTTLMGIVAAINGWKRDSYYEKLSSDNIRIGVRVLTPLKKSFHRLNLLSVKKTGDLSKKLSSDFRGEGGRIQTPFEIVSGLNILKDEVVYQVFLRPDEAGKETFEEIKTKTMSLNPFFNITLGLANFTSSVYDAEVISDDHIQKVTNDDYALLHSALPIHLIDKFEFDKEDFDNYNFVEEDMLPGDFVANNNREVKKMNKILFSTTANPLRVKLNSPYYRLTLKDETINILFMDL